VKVTAMAKKKNLNNQFNSPKRKKKRAIIAGIAGVLIISASIISSALNEYVNPPERISYKQYQEYLNEGTIDIVTYSDNKDYMLIYLGDDKTADMTDEQKEKYDYPESSIFKVQFPNNEDFRKEMLEQGIVLINMTDEKGIASIFDKYGALIVYLALIGVLIVAIRKNNPASATGFARAVASEDIDVTFDDVIGHEEIKEDLKLLVKQMKDGENARNLSHGILFEGGAGTGKTMLAKAIAHEAGLNFISVNSSNLVEMYVGLGARRVRDAFKQARNAAPCVLFFDELDAVGAQRGNQRSHRENDQTINALLTEMDGFQTTDGVFVIAATNRADDLDEALVRAGRFDRKVKIEAPKKWETRKELFDHYLKDVVITDDVDTEILAKQVVGFSGADIAAVIREAKLISYRDDNETEIHALSISQDNIEEAIDKIVFKGNRSDSKQHEEDVKIVAYHESGHAIATIATGGDVSRISIRGMTSGVGGAVFTADNDKLFESKEELENTIMIAYAGRASEEVFFGKEHITQGAGNDISKATAMLYQYIAKYGFDSTFGLIDYDVLVKNGIMTEKSVSERMAALSNELYERTVRLIEENRADVETLAEKMIEVKTMDGGEMMTLLNKKELI
jgi:cell division protease FtsH